MQNSNLLYKPTACFFKTYWLQTCYFQAFTIFCGLGINNTQNYNEVAKAMARQNVALEVLSYHACSSPCEVNAVQVTEIVMGWEWEGR